MKRGSIFEALQAAQAASVTRFKHGDSVTLPSGRTGVIVNKGAEDAHKWADRLGRRMAYRVKFEDGEVAQYVAEWLDRVAA